MTTPKKPKKAKALRSKATHNHGAGKPVIRWMWKFPNGSLGPLAFINKPRDSLGRYVRVEIKEIG